MTDGSGDEPDYSYEESERTPDAHGQALRTRDHQFRALVEAVEEYAIFRLDRDGTVVSWNSGAERIKGYDSEEILGKHFSTFYTEADYTAGVPEQNLAAAADQGSIEDEGWRVRADGSRFWANVTITGILDEDGRLEGYAKVTRDMTDRKRAREEHQLHLSISRSLAEAASLESGLQATVKDVCEWTDWVVGQAWILTDDGFAERLPASYVGDTRFERFEEESREYTFAPGDGIPGQVLESRDAVWFPDVTAVSETVFPRTALATEVGLQAGLGVPVVTDGEVAVVLEFYMAQQHEVDEHLVEVATSIAADLGGLVARKQVEDQLDRERELLAEMMEAAPVGISVLTPDGTVERMNARALDLRSLPAVEEWLDADERIFYDEDGVRVPFDERPFALVRETETAVYDWTAQVELPDGSQKWLSIDAAPIRGDNGELERVVIVEEDVTELREEYRAITESINDVIVTIDENSTIRSVNPAVEEVFGYAPGSLIGESLTELMPDGYAEAHRAGISRYLRTGDRTIDWNYVELPGKRADGTSIPLAISFSEFDHRGEEFFTGVIRDISDRTEYEQQLEDRAEQQQAVAELGQFALTTEDFDELMHEAARLLADVLNNAYCKVLDLDPEAEELLLRQGVGWREGIVGDATVSSVEGDSQAAYTLANAHPIVVEDLETETRFSGPELLTSHDVRSGISTIIGSFDDPWGILGTHDTEPQSFTDEDVNFVQSVANVLAEAIERHRYQENLEAFVTELEVSNERLEQFAYAASHDLQEPLRMVSSYLQLIERRYADALDADGEEFLEFAIDGADRMRDMIDGLLAYSRIERQGNPFESVDLDVVFDDARKNLAVRIEESDAEITAESLPRVRGDPNQLGQVFQNLLDNAIEYSGDVSPRIHVSAARTDERWTISVRDEGIGIAPDDAERVFDVFQRLHTQEEHPGTGIGLALSERIIERHGGTLRVDSEPGEGSTFSFTLPIADGHDG